MMVKWCTRYLAALAVLTYSAGAASADFVTSLDSSYTANYRWYSEVAAAGTTSIDSTVSPPSDSLPGSAKLTTNASNSDKAAATLAGNFGTVSQLISNNVQFSYDYFKQSVVGGNLAAAPALKLTFSNPNFFGDGNVTLIYEPYWNGGNPTANEWHSVNIDLDTGLFWQNGGFGQTNSSGGPPLKTLEDWITTFDSAPTPNSNKFSNATLTHVSMGIGSYNPGQINYFDNVRLAGTSLGAEKTYNFGIAPVPEPGTFGMAGTGILIVLGYARRRRNGTTA